MKSIGRGGRSEDPRATAVYQDCLRLFVENGGEDVTGIEREMREVLGHRQFQRRNLYCRGGRPGWIGRFGWRELVSEPPASAGNAGAPACVDASASRSPHTASGVAGKGARVPSDFHSWLNRVSPGMNWDYRHLKLLYNYLERVTIGDCKRLMIFMPPRHGKSELVTVRYTAKRMIDDPTMHVILGSYNQRLANRFSRKVRRVMADARSADTPVNASEARRSSSSVSSVPSVVRNQDLTTENTESTEIAVPKNSSPYARSGVAEGRGGSSNKYDSSSPRLGVSAVQTSSRFKPANSLEEWETPHGGGLRAVGVGAGVTGYGASLVIIDDPVKSRAEAESKTYRDNLWDWFNDDISTRLEPDGAMILIQTRWHQDDLAGRLLKEMADGGEQWEVLALPAIAEEWNADIQRNADTPVRNASEARTSSSPTSSSPQAAIAGKSVRVPSLDPLGRQPGEALCPQRFTINDLEKLKRKLGSYSFSALYQQRPTPLEGGLFKRAWFTKNVIDKLPVGVQLVRSYDLAVSTRTTADYTTSVLGGFDNRGNFYIADVMRRRMEFPEQKRFILDRMMREPRIQHGIELALHGQAIIQDLRRFAPTRAVALRGIRVDTDKVTRALAWAALAEEGKLFLLRGPWARDFIEETCSFPNSKHDDQVDAVSLAISITTQHKRFRHAGF